MLTHDLDGLRARTAAGRSISFTAALRRRRSDVVSVIWHRPPNHFMGGETPEFAVENVIIETDVGDEIRLCDYLDGCDDITGDTFTGAYADGPTR